MGAVLDFYEDPPVLVLKINWSGSGYGFVLLKKTPKSWFQVWFFSSKDRVPIVVPVLKIRPISSLVLVKPGLKLMVNCQLASDKAQF